MKITGLDADVFVGGKHEPSEEEAHKLASTKHEDQNEDPGTTQSEKDRIWRMLGFHKEEGESHSRQTL